MSGIDDLKRGEANITVQEWAGNSIESLQQENKELKSRNRRLKETLTLYAIPEPPEDKT